MQKIDVFARNLRFLRQIRGDTQKDIADLLMKTTAQAITKIEKGESGLSVTDLMKLCARYKVGETEFCHNELWRMTDDEIERLRRRWEGKEERVMHGVNL